MYDTLAAVSTDIPTLPAHPDIPFTRLINIIVKHCKLRVIRKTGVNNKREKWSYAHSAHRSTLVLRQT